MELRAADRRVSHDYTRRAHALSDTHFGRSATFKRESINSNVTIEALTDDEEDIDAFYLGGSSDGDDKSYKGERSASRNVLRLSSRGLLKPKMNPKSLDSDNGMKIFSRNQDNYLQGVGSRTG